MAASIWDWSVVAANNSNADADLTWAEGQAPSTVNNSARVMMQRVRQLLTDIGGSIAAGGTANGLTVTASSPFAAYADGMIVSFRATASNTGAATLSVNGIGAKAIRKMDSTGDVALIADEIRNTGIYVAQYSAALNGAAGAWLLVNPTFVVAATQTFSGMILVPTNKNYKIVVKVPFAGIITNTTTISASGTCTAAWQVEGVSMGTNAVSSAEVSTSRSTAFAAGNDITIGISANAACLDMSFTITYTRASP